MSKYFKFNDKNTYIIKLDNFYYSHFYQSCVSDTYHIEIVLEKDEKYDLSYEDKEIMEKDVIRLTRFLNKKEELL